LKRLLLTVLFAAALAATLSLHAQRGDADPISIITQPLPPDGLDEGIRRVLLWLPVARR